MPDPSLFNDKEQLIQYLKSELGIKEQQKQERIAEVIREEAEADEGNPQKLLQSIKNGAKSILSSIGLETVSWVENPSQDSMFVMMKNSDNRVKKSTNIYKEPGKENDWSTVYGPVMRPNDIDKDGDIAPAHDIRKAAHEFMAEGRVKQFDTDHDLNTGKGTLVESWILKEDTEYELPDGSTEVIEEGSWMVGVQPNQQVKQRIENGEITGWSIFGQADKIELKTQPQWKNFNNHHGVNKGKDTMSNQEPEPEKGEELSLKEVHSTVKELKESFEEFKESPEPSTVKSMEELANHVKNQEQEDTPIMLGEDFTLETTEKEPEMEDLAGLMDYLEDQLNEENFSMLVDAVRGDTQEEVEEEEDNDPEDEEEKTSEEKEETGKSVKHKAKQVNTQVEKDSRKGVSFRNRITG